MKRLNNKGLSLIELLISMSMSLVAALAFMTLLVLGTNSFYSTVEQIQASESVTTASFYLRMFLSQAVKVSCCSGVACVGVGPRSALPSPLNLVATATEPAGISEGLIDCRDGVPGMWAPGVENALALYVRDAGQLVTGGQAASEYRGAAVYFIPPVNDSNNTNLGNNSGQLVIGDALPGAPMDRFLTLNHLIDIGVIPGSVEVASTGYLKAIAYKIVARNFNASVFGTKHFRITGPQPTASYKDTETTVKIIFRNNRLGTSLVNGTTSERPLGQLYFFKFAAPRMGVL